MALNKKANDLNGPTTNNACYSNVDDAISTLMSMDAGLQLKVLNPILVGGGGGGVRKNYPQEKDVTNGKNNRPRLFTKQNSVFDVSLNFQVNLSF